MGYGLANIAILVLGMWPQRYLQYCGGFGQSRSLSLRIFILEEEGVVVCTVHIAVTTLDPRLNGQQSGSLIATTASQHLESL